jgi:dynein heavy chain
VVTQIEPKRQLLARSEAELAAATEELSVVEALVADLNAKLAVLMEQYDKALKTKNDAVAEAEK